MATFTVPAHKLDERGVKEFVRALCIRYRTETPEEMLSYYVNERPGKPVRLPSADVNWCWKPETRQVGWAAGGSHVHVSAMYFLPDAERGAIDPTLTDLDWVAPGFAPTTDLDAFCAEVRAQDPGVIIIDGMLGAGKTTLAEQVAARFGATMTLIHLDSYLPPPGGPKPYVHRLDLVRLRSDVEVATVPLCIEGVCVRDAMDRIGVAHDCSIYVMCISQAGIWHYGRTLEDAQSFAEEAACGVSHRSVAIYHRTRLPHLTSTFRFIRRDD